MKKVTIDEAITIVDSQAGVYIAQAAQSAQRYDWFKVAAAFEILRLLKIARGDKLGPVEPVEIVCE